MAINPNGIATLDLIGDENFIDPVHYGVQAKRVALENVFIMLRTRNNIIVTDELGEARAAQSGMLLLTRVKRVSGKGRTLGRGDVHGTIGNNDLMNKVAAEHAATQQYWLPLLHRYDSKVFIERAAGQMVNVDIVNGTIQNIAGNVQEQIDASTLATMLASVARYGVLTDPDPDGQASDELTNHVILPETLVAESYWTAVKNAQKTLLKGDMTHGIGQFELTGIVGRPEFIYELLSRQGVIIGGSNYAQTMVMTGAVDPQTAYGNWGTGTLGILLGKPVIGAPDLIWNLAKEWVDGGLNTAFNTYAELIQALVVDYKATVRGIVDEYMNIIQSTENNVLNFLPSYRWGVECLYGSGIVPIASFGVQNPYDPDTSKLEVFGPQGFDPGN
jgi:hypothetical protein